MSELRASSCSIRAQLPAFSSELVLAGRPVFAYEWLEGLALDSAVAGFDGMVLQAAEVLLQFNRDSLRRVAVGASEFELLAGQYCAGLAQRYPTLAPAAARLRAQLERLLLGQELPVVWLHGDYKLENLLFRPPAPPKVIDWELAQSMGLPLLDMLYLLAYRRVTLGRAEDMLELLEPLLQGGNWEPWEQELLSRAAALATLPAAQLPVVHALLLVQHAGLRFDYSQLPGVERATAVIGTLLATATTQLANADRNQSWN
jgi:aminoglycoside phosphotransferase (APT) family kinase protein